MKRLAPAGPGDKARNNASQRGAAMIEMAFMLFFVSFFVLFLIYGYTLYETMTRTLEDLRYEWRQKSEKQAGKDFSLVSLDKTATMEVSGFVGDKLDQRTVKVKLSLKGYAGSYTGTGKNVFERQSGSTRKIQYE